MDLRGIKEIIVSPWQGCQKTSALENSVHAIHKICVQISLSLKVTLLSRVVKKKKKKKKKNGQG